MSNSSTYIGKVTAVTGSSISISFLPSISSGIAIIDGTTYRIGQVGSFLRIPQGYKNLYCIVCEVGEKPESDITEKAILTSGRWVTAQLVGESVGASFERGISEYPNVSDPVHLVTERDLQSIYGLKRDGHVEIGRLTSAENITVKLDLDKLVTRHSAILGSTGSGKSTTVASLLRTLVASESENLYPSARLLLIDIHGEYSSALYDVANVFKIDPNHGEHKLAIPYWALEAEELVAFLFGNLDSIKQTHVYDKITELKLNRITKETIKGIVYNSLTVDTPIPYSLNRLWLELIEPELTTYEGPNRDIPAKLANGDALQLIEPKFKPHAMGNQGPFLNTTAPGIRRQLKNLRSRLLDRQYDFLLHPGDWEPDLDGFAKKDLSELLQLWLGQEKPITILDLSGVPSTVLLRLIGSILKIVYTALFWSRDKSEGGIDRPLLIIMEEAHRYLHDVASNAKEMVQQIVKEGRKYGVGAMIVSQRPSEVDETILSQCGTFFGLRLSNANDRNHVKGTLPDSLAGLMDMLPVLRTGEAIITGEAATLPIRCKIMLPDKLPNSRDPKVAEQWSNVRRSMDHMSDVYDMISASWRSQSPTFLKDPSVRPHRSHVEDNDEY